VNLETLERAYQREEFEIARWRSHHRLELAIGTAAGIHFVNKWFK
jgi:hypothetical protein